MVKRNKRDWINLINEIVCNKFLKLKDYKEFFEINKKRWGSKKKISMELTKKIIMFDQLNGKEYL